LKKGAAIRKPDEELEMEIKDKQVDGITVLLLTGSIDALTAPQISEFIQGHITRGNIKLVADLSGVDYTSSAGLRVLLGAIKETRAQSGDLRLTGVQPDVRKVLSLSGFTNILKLFDSLEAAVASYS
jgi:anti-anti-sigma factor